jgi:hypothetical protein
VLVVPLVYLDCHVRYGNHRVGSLREDPNTVLMAVRA